MNCPECGEEIKSVRKSIPGYYHVGHQRTSYVGKKVTFVEIQGCLVKEAVLEFLFEGKENG